MCTREYLYDYRPTEHKLQKKLGLSYFVETKGEKGKMESKGLLLLVSVDKLSCYLKYIYLISTELMRKL